MRGSPKIPAAAKRLEDVLQRLRDAGHRVTPQRVAILEALVTDPGHPSAERLYKAVSGRFPSMSLATVYKTLSLLKDQSEVLELGFAGQENRYDGLMPRPHPHLICTRCGQIVDPPFLDLEGLTREMAERTGFVIDHHRLDFYGLCPACQDEKRKGLR